MGKRLIHFGLRQLDEEFCDSLAGNIQKFHAFFRGGLSRVADAAVVVDAGEEAAGFHPAFLQRLEPERPGVAVAGVLQIDQFRRHRQ